MDYSNLEKAFSELLKQCKVAIDIFYFNFEEGSKENTVAKALDDNYSEFCAIHTDQRITWDFKLKMLNKLYKKHKEEIIKSLKEDYDLISKHKITLDYIQSSKGSKDKTFSFKINYIYNIALQLRTIGETNPEFVRYVRLPDDIMFTFYNLLSNSTICVNEEELLNKKLHVLRTKLGIKDSKEEGTYSITSLFSNLMNGGGIGFLKNVLNEENVTFLKENSETLLGNTKLVDILSDTVNNSDGIIDLGKKLLDNDNIEDVFTDTLDESKKKLFENNGIKEAAKGVTVIMKSIDSSFSNNGEESSMLKSITDFINHEEENKEEFEVLND